MQRIMAVILVALLVSACVMPPTAPSGAAEEVRLAAAVEATVSASGLVSTAAAHEPSPSETPLPTIVPPTATPEPEPSPTPPPPSPTPEAVRVPEDWVPYTLPSEATFWHPATWEIMDEVELGAQFQDGHVLYFVNHVEDWCGSWEGRDDIDILNCLLAEVHLSLLGSTVRVTHIGMQRLDERTVYVLDYDEGDDLHRLAVTSLAPGTTFAVLRSDMSRGRHGEVDPIFLELLLATAQPAPMSSEGADGGSGDAMVAPWNAEIEAMRAPEDWVLYERTAAGSTFSFRHPPSWRVVDEEDWYAEFETEGVRYSVSPWRDECRLSGRPNQVAALGCLNNAVMTKYMAGQPLQLVGIGVRDTYCGEVYSLEYYMDGALWTLAVRPFEGDYSTAHVLRVQDMDPDMDLADATACLVASSAEWRNGPPADQPNPTADELEVRDVVWSIDEAGGSLRVRGYLLNTTGFTIVSMYVTIETYDGGGALLSSDTVRADARSISPEHMTTFTLSIEDPGPVERVEVAAVQGQWRR